jgi:hypothetical protein
MSFDFSSHSRLYWLVKVSALILTHFRIPKMYFEERGLGTLAIFEVRAFSQPSLHTLLAPKKVRCVIWLWKCKILRFRFSLPWGGIEEHRLRLWVGRVGRSAPMYINCWEEGEAATAIARSSHTSQQEWGYGLFCFLICSLHACAYKRKFYSKQPSLWYLGGETQFVNAANLRMPGGFRRQPAFRALRRPPKPCVSTSWV